MYRVSRYPHELKKEDSLTETLTLFSSFKTTLLAILITEFAMSMSVICVTHYEASITKSTVYDTEATISVSSAMTLVISVLMSA
jgi:hypothetical protein